MSQKYFDFTIRELLPYLADRVAFKERIPTWVMVGPPAVDEGEGWSFRTDSIQTVKDPETGNVLVLENQYEVRLLQKARSGPFQDTILIGRSITSDVVIPDPSISKLHVRIRLGSSIAQATVADANSSNGTTYKNKKLAPDEVVELTDASTLLIGGRYFYLLSSDKFRQMLLKMFNGLPHYSAFHE